MTAAAPLTRGPSWVPQRLNHLRRDSRGLPVPFVNRWGPEDTERYEIRPDATVRGDALFLDDDDQGEPDFTKQSMQRQRWCMVHGWCQVCGREVPWSRRYLVVSSISVNRINVNGEQHVSISEPWLDQRCAVLALERCPGLIRRRRDEDMALVKVTSARQVGLAVSTGWVEGPLAERTQAEPVAMWVKVLVPDRLVRIQSCPAVSR